jgi:flavin-dependent dehydrogenase
MAQPNDADADVIIAGAGGSGLAAAARCVELGVSVIVLEKQPKIGGTKQQKTQTTEDTDLNAFP